MDEPAGFVQIVVLVCFVLLPAVVALIGVILLMRAQRFRASATQVTGTVVSIETIKTIGAPPGEEVSYLPTFEYDAPDGTRKRAQAGSYGHVLRDPVGSQRPIWVDRNDPTVAHTSRHASLVVALACIGIGGIMALMGMYALSGGQAG